jgi:flagellar protein FliS
VRLVVCLYEQAISDLRRAAMAMEKGDIEVRTRDINHALLVIGQLQGTLDMEAGGEVARNLQRFYNVLRAGLIEAQGKQSKEMIEQQIAILAAVHEAWQQVERDPVPAQPAHETAKATPLATEERTSFSDWNA